MFPQGGLSQAPELVSNPWLWMAQHQVAQSFGNASELLGLNIINEPWAGDPYEDPAFGFASWTYEPWVAASIPARNMYPL